MRYRLANEYAQIGMGIRDEEARYRCAGVRDYVVSVAGIRSDLL